MKFDSIHLPKVRGKPPRFQPQHDIALKLTASLPLKMDGWNTSFLLGLPISGAMLVLGRVTAETF